MAIQNDNQLLGGQLRKAAHTGCVPGVILSALLSCRVRLLAGRRRHWWIAANSWFRKVVSGRRSGEIDHRSASRTT